MKDSILMPNWWRNLLLIPTIFVVHIIYNAIFDFILFEITNSIRGINYDWFSFGGYDWSFATPLYALGTYLIYDSHIIGCIWDGGWGLPLHIVASAFTAIVTAAIIQKYFNNENNIFGKYYWRLFLVIPCWIFIPVPLQMTLYFNFMILC